MVKQKTQPQKLITEIAEDLIIYLKSGQLAPNSFIKELNLEINNLQQLLRIHFILKDEVRKFIEKLPTRLRNIKTSTQKITQFLQGEVRGKINWQDTIKSRCKRNNLKQNIFVCQQMDRNFNIKENLVLKELLRIIHQITIGDLKMQQKDYSWLADWLGDKELANQLEKIYFKNIYLRRIKQEKVMVTTRMITDTKRSRNLLYQEAAQLLDLYRRLTNINEWTEDEQAEVRSLLNNTFIKPQNDDVLFELYWIIKLLNANTDNKKLNPVDGSSNLVASWEEDEKRYSIYHDAVGSGRLKWQIGLTELEKCSNHYLRRKVAGRKLSQKLTKDIFDKSLSDNYWKGRPDLVIEIIDKETEELEKVIIGEVKYTNQFSTAKQGLKELADYLALIKDEVGYINDKGLTESRVELEGFLLLDKVENSIGSKIKGIRIYNQQSKWLTEIYDDRELRLFIK